VSCTIRRVLTWARISTRRHVVVYPVRADVAERPELARRYAEGSAERHYLGVMAGEFVFGKYRSSIAATQASGAARGA